MGYFWLIPVGSAIWVGIDASSLGFKRGRLGGGTLDMGVTSYVLATLLIWIIGFPCYLVARTRYVERKNQHGYGYGATPAYGNPAFGTAAYGEATDGSTPYGAASYGVRTAPPQYSPDGQWWWNGQVWTPVSGGGTPT